MRKLLCAFALATIGLASAASASTYTVDMLINSNADGFGSSVIHKQYMNGDMSGKVAGKFSEAVGDGGVWEMDGDIYFSGWLNGGDYKYKADGNLNMNGAGKISFYIMSTVKDWAKELTFYFADANYVGPANGFDGEVISLWGETGTCKNGLPNGNGNGSVNGGGYGKCWGTDLRIKVSKVPEIPLPASALLLVGSIGALAGLRRKRKAA